jgi:hypothetical protein
MEQQSKLLTLPRELRDIIYYYYLEVEGGYIPNYTTRKLFRADGQPVDLTLTYACKQVAAEMHGLALEVNSITFSTVYSDAAQKRVGFYAASVKSLFKMKNYLHIVAPECFDAETVAKILQEYPEFLPIVNLFQNGGEIDPNLRNLLFLKNYGELPSRYRHFVSDIFNLLSTTNRSGFRETISALLPISSLGKTLDLDKSLALSYDCQPWIIATEEEVQNLCHILGREPFEPQEYSKRTKYRFSAASVALRIVGSWSAQCLSQVRNIVLNEDQVSVAWPECHAQGFISLCQDNPALRVERRVNLWRNAFPGIV